MSPLTLARDILGVHFQNPVLLASGTAGFGREVDGVIDLERLGGIVTKAVSLEPRAGNRPPRVAEFQGGMLNSVGLANPGLSVVTGSCLPWLAARLSRARVLINVVGFTAEDFRDVVLGLENSPGVSALELNLSCPNTSAGGVEFGADPASVTRVVSLCRQATRPLFAKLSPALPDIGAMAVVARDAGADGITVVNTIPGDPNDAAGAPRLGHGNGGVSGPALLAVGVQATRKVLELTGGIPVIGVGGIRTAADARQYLQAGAALVAIGTAALADPRVPERVVRGLEAADAEIVVALDLPEPAAVWRLLDRIPQVKWVKLGPVLMTRAGPDLVRELVARGLRVFLDLKWHDIPSTVAGAVEAATALGVSMATVHTLGGGAMLAAAAAAAGPGLGLVGVTVLTSHDSAGFSAIVGRERVVLAQEVDRLARTALAAGLRGVVCSPWEVAAVRDILGDNHWIVVPGIRRPGDPVADQARAATPAQAVRAGATHLVVGRPILQAADPAAVFRELAEATR